MEIPRPSGLRILKGSVRFLKMSKEKIDVLFSDIVYPKEFHKRLNDFNYKSNSLDFFIKNNEMAYVIAILHNKNQEEIIDKISKAQASDCFYLLNNKGVILFDDDETKKDLLNIKKRIEDGIPFRNFCNWFISNAIIFHKNSCIHPDSLTEKEKKENPATMVISTKIVDGMCISYCLCVTNGILLNEPYISEIIQLSTNKIKYILKNKNNTKPKRKPIDSRLRHECFKRDNYRCLECGATNYESQLHADHIIPVSQGGTDELDNLQTLCDRCNISKKDKCWKNNNKK